jgi:hypothetical protein
MEDERKDRTTVRIYTDNFMILGEIAMFPDTRLTDYIIGARDFVAIINAVVHDFEEKALFSTEFLNIQKDKIVAIMPEAMVKPV